MLLALKIRSLPVSLLLVAAMCNVACGQDPEDAPPARRPGVSLGGPFGVLFGGGRGLRIGGPNGAQFGGGVGARFGGENGAQFGGGEGVRIGPRDDRSADGDAAAENLPGRFINPAFENPLPHEIVMHHPLSAGERLQIRIDGQDVELYPGDTFAVPRGASGVSLQIARPFGGYGWRRTIRPGTYIFQQSGRGWSIAAGTIPRDQQAPGAEPDDTGVPNRLQIDEPEVEQIPSPAPAAPTGRDVSEQDPPRRWLFFRRR